MINRPNTKRRGMLSLLMKAAFLVVLMMAVNPSFSQSKYVQKYRPTADSLSAEYGIPASVILAVAILESGSGTSRNAKLLNNHFGIVGKNKVKHVKTKYKQYESVYESYKDFCKVIKKKKF